MKQNKLRQGFSGLIIILVIAIIALAAIVAFSLFHSGKLTGQPTMHVTQPQDQQVKNLQSLSRSDSVSDIDKDVNSTDVGSLDAGLDQVNNDINSL